MLLKVLSIVARLFDFFSPPLFKNGFSFVFVFKVWTPQRLISVWVVVTVCACVLLMHTGAACLKPDTSQERDQSPFPPSLKVWGFCSIAVFKTSTQQFRKFNHCNNLVPLRGPTQNELLSNISTMTPRSESLRDIREALVECTGQCTCK